MQFEMFSSTLVSWYKLHTYYNYHETNIEWLIFLLLIIILYEVNIIFLIYLLYVCILQIINTRILTNNF